MTIYDISRLAGVSIATVSRVLNNSEKVSEKTRRRVLSIIDETGYVPSFSRNDTVTKEIGIVCTTITDMHNAFITEYLTTNLQRSGFNIRLFCSGSDLNDKKGLMSRLGNTKMDALIIEGRDFMEYEPQNNSYIKTISDNFPVFLLNAYMEGPNIYCVTCEEELLIYSLTYNLIKSGRNDILFLFSSMSPYYMSMLEGFKRALMHHGTEPCPQNIHRCTGGYEDTLEYICEQIKSGKKTDAILATDDILASAAFFAAQSLELRIPDDIEIIGHKTPISSQITPPAVTAINCREEELCITMLSTIRNVLNNLPAASRINIPATLIHRSNADRN